jgi:hypothetical protein
MIMTQDKALKAAIRARMAQAGEPYSVARHVILADGPLGGERGGTEASAEYDLAADQADDYFAIYLREAREAGVPEDEIEAMAAAHRPQERLREAREFADRAEELAEQAEEAADLAEERASLAEESAELAEEWADPVEQRAARLRAARMQAEFERARELADRARQKADLAEEQAELAEEAADLDEDETDDDDDDDSAPGWSWGGPPRPPRPARPPRPPRPPRPTRPHFTGTGPFMSKLDLLEQRFEEMQDRAATFLDKLGIAWPAD